MKDHPYTGLPNQAFWRHSITNLPVGLIDPMQGLPSFKIGRSDLVSTMGSCFAQHISRNLLENGFKYFIKDIPQSGLTESLRSDGFGIFSARYGNVYTLRQAVQLYDLAMGKSEIEIDEWISSDKKKFVDSLRPQAIPKCFKTRKELLEDRSRLLESVKSIFCETEIMIFTLGLTEGWLNSQTGQIYATAPGVSGGKYDSNFHMPFNTEIEECQALLHYLITEANKINKSIKWILTVSPVPLAATHTSQHVLVANTISKSTLRLVAQYAANKFSNVFYFPSYEIVDGLKQQGSYFSSNARDVENRGVGHAMRVFSKHFLKDDIIDKNQKLNLEKEFQRQRNIQCDEDTVFNL